jgi:crotonobetainyl-CoA:carnitine CoA-transferase CaiB-like acyl-CoA transferase
LDKAFAAKPLSYWREELDKLHLTFGVVQTIEELANDPQLIFNGNIKEINNGTGTKSFTVDSPVYVHGEEKVQPGLAPALGEHNTEILTELGYSAGEIDVLSTNGVIPLPKKAA